MTRLRLHQRSLEELVNERVQIQQVFELHHFDVPYVESGVSIKVRCPWGDLHLDGGVEASLRVYGESNHAYCFAGCGLMTPVGFHAEQKGIPRKQALDLIRLIESDVLGARQDMLIDLLTAVVRETTAGATSCVHSRILLLR